MIFAHSYGSSFAGIDPGGIVTGMDMEEPVITQHTLSQRDITPYYWLQP